MLPRPLRQESLSKAYIRAIAAKAGLICVESEYDFGIDMRLGTVVTRAASSFDPGVYLNLSSCKFSPAS